MLIPFQQCEITVSGIRILIEIGSLTTPDNMEQFIPFGFQNTQGHTIIGQQESNLSLTYLPEINNDPIFTGIKDLLTSYNSEGFNAFPIVLNNLSGQFYINNYNLTIQEGNIARAQVNFTSFTDISGSITGTIGINSYNNSNGNNLISYFTTSLLLDGQHAYHMNKIHNFNYTCNFDWQPTYVLGQNRPLFINFPRRRRAASA